MWVSCVSIYSNSVTTQPFPRSFTPHEATKTKSLVKLQGELTGPSTAKGSSTVVVSEHTTEKADEQFCQSPPLGKKGWERSLFVTAQIKAQSTEREAGELNPLHHESRSTGQTLEPKADAALQCPAPTQKGALMARQKPALALTPHPLPGTSSGFSVHFRGLGHRGEQNSPGMAWKTPWDDLGWIPGAHQSCPIALPLNWAGRRK